MQQHQSNQNFMQQNYNINSQQQYTNTNFKQQQLNQNFSQQPSNPNLQQFSNNNNIQQIPMNSNMEQQFSNQNMQNQPSNPNFEQQFPNHNYQQSRISSMPQHFPNQNMQQFPHQNPHQMSANTSMQQPFPNRNIQRNPSNSNFPQQPSNPNIPQLPSNPNFPQFPSNPNFQQQPSNPSFPQQPSNPNIPQLPSNPNFPQPPSNPNFQQQSSNPNFQQQSSNPNFRQQPSNPNFQQQSSNPNFQRQSSNQSFSRQPSNQSFSQFSSNQSFSHLPSIPTPTRQPQNETFSQQTTDLVRPARGFPVIYDNFTYIVDPVSLSTASHRFKELIDPFINDFTQMREHHLVIYGNQFSKRNMNNFLKICQNLPTDVQNSEMKEICEIAKMFRADEIYNKGLSFIQANEDPNFNVPDSKYDGSDGIQYLTIQGEATVIQHSADMSDAYFEDVNNKSYQGNYYKINTNSNDDEHNNDKNVNNKQSEPNKRLMNDSESNMNEKQDENKSENANRNETQNEDNKSIKNLSKQHPIVYQVRFENHTFKCPVFKFVSDHRIIYSAKQKYNEIFIGEGSEVHIRNRKSHVCYILQNETTKTNKVRIGDNLFEVKYVGSGNINHYSIEVIFTNKGKTLSWIPKQPRYDPKTDKYYLNFHGEYHHTPILSSRNMVLQNQEKQTTFIVRRMDQNVFEIECSPEIDPLIAFTIGLSDIVGPYLDPWANNGTDLL